MIKYFKKFNFFLKFIQPFMNSKDPGSQLIRIQIHNTVYIWRQCEASKTAKTHLISEWIDFYVI